MKSHRFTLIVTGAGTRKRAEIAVLSSFASRKPDWWSFSLQKSKPKKEKVKQPNP